MEAGNEYMVQGKWFQMLPLCGISQVIERTQPSFFLQGKTNKSQKTKHHQDSNISTSISMS